MFTCIGGVSLIGDIRNFNGIIRGEISAKGARVFINGVEITPANGLNNRSRGSVPTTTSIDPTVRINTDIAHSVPALASVPSTAPASFILPNTVRVPVTASARVPAQPTTQTPAPATATIRVPALATTQTPSPATATVRVPALSTTLTTVPAPATVRVPALFTTLTTVPATATLRVPAIVPHATTKITAEIEVQGHDIQCNSCLSDIQAIASSGTHILVMKCGHVFCERCRAYMVRRKIACPRCGMKLLKKNSRRLYL